MAGPASRVFADLSQPFTWGIFSRRYPVRIAVVNLDKPPRWWHEQAADHMTADEARAFAGTDGEHMDIALGRCTYMQCGWSACCMSGCYRLLLCALPHRTSDNAQLPGSSL